MKKIFVLFLLLIVFTTGCDVNYTLEIDESSFVESTTITTDERENETYNNTSLTVFLDSLSSSFIPSYFNPENYEDLDGNYQEGVRYYQISPYQLNSNKGLTAEYSFTNGNLYRSRAIKECFPEIDIQLSDSTYRINTNMGCKAFDTYSLLDNLTINIINDYSVIYHNADSVDGNMYTWNINQDNFSSKYISFTYTMLEEDLSEFDPTNVPGPDYVGYVRNWANENPVLVVLISFGTFIVVIAGVLIYKNKSNK